MITGNEASTMRYFYRGRFQQQFRFLRPPFLQDRELPFCKILSCGAVVEFGFCRNTGKENSVLGMLVGNASQIVRHSAFFDWRLFRPETGQLSLRRARTFWDYGGALLHVNQNAIVLN